MVGSSTKLNGVDTDSIKNAALKDLLDIVDSVRGKKALVLDPTRVPHLLCAQEDHHMH